MRLCFRLIATDNFLIAVYDNEYDLSELCYTVAGRAKPIALPATV
jgi:hypothetical protein